MKHPTIVIAALGAALLGAVPTAGAAEPGRTRRARAEATDADADAAARRGKAGAETRYTFDDDRLEGLVLRSEGLQIDGHDRAVFAGLITVRGLFTPELVRMARDL